MLDALPDDGHRYEIIDGVLFVSPAPSNVHQHVVTVLTSRLEAYLQPHEVASAYVATTEVRREGRQLRQIDRSIGPDESASLCRLYYRFLLHDLL